MKSVLLVSHGSRSPETKQEVEKLLLELKSKSSIKILEYAFLEIESPNIQEGLQKCIEQGSRDILVLLNFLNSGKHVDEDIPRIVEEARGKHPDLKVRISQPIGQHEKIAELFLDLI